MSFSLKRKIKDNRFLYNALIPTKKFLGNNLIGIFLDKHFFKDLGIQFFSYTLYKYLCLAFNFKKIKVLDKQQIHKFHKTNILVLDEFVSNEKVENFSKDLILNLKNNKITSSQLMKRIKPIPRNKFLKLIRFIKDRYFKNIIFYYAFPDNYLSETHQIKNPLLNINGFRNELIKYFIPVLNDLMGTKSSIYRAWAYKTININNKETNNANNNLHRDGDILSAIKCIIYLSDVDENNGPFCFKDIDGKVKPVYGKKGTVILFKSAFLRHKGANTLKRDRLAASFTAYPSLINKVAIKDVKPDYIRKNIPFLPESKECFLI